MSTHICLADAGLSESEHFAYAQADTNPMPTPYFRLEKLKPVQKIGVAARHNRRESNECKASFGPIDLEKSLQNETIFGPATACQVVEHAKTLRKNASPKNLRKDAVQAIELLFSLPPNHGIDDKAFFACCLEWTARHFGGYENILSADIHRDEATPHCHMLLMPLINNRMNGADMAGNQATNHKRHQDFYETVSSKFGFSPPVKKLHGKTKEAAYRYVLDALKAKNDAVLESAIWHPIRSMIARNPAPFLQHLGIGDIRQPSKKVKTMAAIFTSPGKGARHHIEL